MTGTATEPTVPRAQSARADGAQPTAEQFQSEFVKPVREWCAARADKVAGCYVPLPTGYIRVFVVTNSRRYDFELGEEVAALERQLAYAGWRASVMQLPAAAPESQAAFFNPETALEVYAQRGPAPAEGGE
jgi:hypothetical protein